MDDRTDECPPVGVRSIYVSPMEGITVAYEVIKRVGGRAYRYRVESYRDPETRRVRGKWTYLGRVEGEGTLSPERQARPNSRTRLLNALEQLLETKDLAALTTGIIANHAGLAYGTFYRYFKDVDHIVREAMLRYSAAHDRERDELFAHVGSAAIESEKINAWLNALIAHATAQRGLIRAWHIASNADATLITERQKRFEAAVTSFASYMRRLDAAGLCTVRNPDFSAYGLVALCTAIERECAVEAAFVPAKVAGLRGVMHDLLGLTYNEAGAMPEAVGVYGPEAVASYVPEAVAS